jgi:hypothetical protein
MEITFTQSRSYSLDLDEAGERQLAKALGIKVSKMRDLIDDQELTDDHFDRLIEWVADNIDDAEVTQEDEIEIEEIMR